MERNLIAAQTLKHCPDSAGINDRIGMEAM
jgi:hypothetical protein